MTDTVNQFERFVAGEACACATGQSDSLDCNPKAHQAPRGCVLSGVNELHFGDNIDVLEAMPSESVDLIYLDPPFNSNASYNVLYGTKRGGPSQAQSHAMRGARNWAEFYEMLDRSLPRFNETLQLPFYDTQAMERLPQPQWPWEKEAAN